MLESIFTEGFADKSGFLLPNLVPDALSEQLCVEVSDHAQNFDQWKVLDALEACHLGLKVFQLLQLDGVFDNYRAD